MMRAATKWDVNVPFDEAEAVEINRDPFGSISAGAAPAGDATPREPMRALLSGRTTAPAGAAAEVAEPAFARSMGVD